MRSIFVLLLLLQAGCSTTPGTVGEVSYSDLRDTALVITISHPDDAFIRNRAELYSNITRGLNHGWPDLRIIENRDDINLLYCLDVEVLGYKVEYSTHNTTEVIDKEKNHYVIYTTSTELHFKYAIRNTGDNRIAWSKTLISINAKENKELDSCYSSNPLKEILCEAIIEPMTDEVINLAFSPFGMEMRDDKYPAPVKYENMFYEVAKDIGESLPTPTCSIDGYSKCIAHFFRNTLGL